jgi:dGTPase
MTLRQQHEAREDALHPLAVRSAASQGRKIAAAGCDIRTEFQKDRDRITHSKAFRRLMHKTQVFISPEGDHFRTRLTHTLEVAQIARTVARALRLNEDLTEAIALGHDLGHTPFGHTGEDALDKLLPGGFQHNEQSVRVCEVLENDGAGLNLTREVLDGILNHRTRCSPATHEGQVVQICDKIAYMNHDVDDAFRAGLLGADCLPAAITDTIGHTSAARIDFLVRDLIRHSAGLMESAEPAVCLSPAVAECLMELRAFMFANVYAHQLHAKERGKIQKMIALLYEYFMENAHLLPPHHSVADYIACMTDRFAQKQFRDIFTPASFSV